MRLRHSSARGFSSIEVAVVIAIVAILTSVSVPQMTRIMRHARLRSAVREIYSLVLATRMQAVKRDSQVVLSVDRSAGRIKTWADNVPYNFLQDADEPTINGYNLPQYVYVQKVDFDWYGGSKKIKDMIVFQGDGTLVDPQKKQSKPASRPTPYTAQVPPGSVDCKKGCRGIYISDRPDGDEETQNLFRISVDDFGSSGRASLLKRLSPDQGGNKGEINYVPPPWSWVD